MSDLLGLHVHFGLLDQQAVEGRRVYALHMHLALDDRTRQADIGHLRVLTDLLGAVCALGFEDPLGFTVPPTVASSWVVDVVVVEVIATVGIVMVGALVIGVVVAGSTAVLVIYTVITQSSDTANSPLDKLLYISKPTAP